MAHQQVSAGLPRCRGWGCAGVGALRLPPISHGRQVWIFILHIRCCPGSFPNAELVAESRQR